MNEEEITSKITEILKQIKFKKYTYEQAFACLKSYYEIGLCAASRKHNISRKSIMDWLNPGKNATSCKASYNKNYDQRQEKWQAYYKENADKLKTQMKEIRMKQGAEGLARRRAYMQNWNTKNKVSKVLENA